jgi:hypothetical protein
MKKIVDYIIKSRSESFCAKPKIEDRDKVEIATERSTKGPSTRHDNINNINNKHLRMPFFFLS